MLKFRFANELEKILKKIKNKKDLNNIKNKIFQITNTGNFKDLDIYKNLRKPLNKYKRVHINKHFVLLFRYSKEEDLIIFEYYAHHDEVYK